MRIIQILPVLARGDAIGNDTFALHHAFSEEGYFSEIYAKTLQKGMASDHIKWIHQLPVLTNEDICIYHASTGSGLTERLSHLGGRKIMIYHNITPSAFFHDYSRTGEFNAIRGLQEIEGIAQRRIFDYCIADSDFNRQNLRELGFDVPVDVCPIMVPFEDYNQAPNTQTLRRYQEPGITNWVFVGRVVPNKKYEDLLRTFYYYHHYLNPRSRLFFVGSYDIMKNYYSRLEEYTRTLDLADAVFFTGHVRFDEILAYYQLADAFVCMSEHEGFCVPLLEAMHFHVPVFAYNCAAVPETLGSSGVLLMDIDPRSCARIIYDVLTDEKKKARIISSQDERLKDFQYPVVKARFLSLLNQFVRKV